MFWDEVWNKKDIEEYRQYLTKYENISNRMTDVFHENGCKVICDAACGFGANSLVLLQNGFEVYGFDIAENSVWITTHLLDSYGIKSEQYKKASLLDTGYPDHFFDAVAVRDALDHVSVSDCKIALQELRRITKKNGLLYASFDQLEEDDLELEHTILEDGSFLYQDENRKGMLFHYYKDEELKQLFANNTLLYMGTDRRGSREFIIKF